MAQCPECGHAVAPDHAFCKGCGAAVRDVGTGGQTAEPSTAGGTESSQATAQTTHTSLPVNGLLALLLGFTGLALVMAGAGVTDTWSDWSVVARWAGVGLGGALLLGAYGQVKRRVWGWAVALLAYATPVVAAVVEAAFGGTITPDPWLVATLFAVGYLVVRAPYFGIERATVSEGLDDLGNLLSG